MHATRQPLLLLLLTLGALVAAALVRRAEFGFLPGETGSEWLTDAGAWIVARQAAWPRTARALTGLLLCGTALVTGRTAVRYNLAAGGSLLAIPLCAAAACGIFVSEHHLLYALTAFLFVCSVRHFCAAYRNEYTFTNCFRGAFCLGFLPLLTIQTLPLAGLLPVAVLLFKRTFRETLVALAGLLLPGGCCCYLGWALGGSLLQPVDRAVGILTQAPLLHLFADLSPVAMALLLWWLSAILCGAFVFLNKPFAFSTKARAVLIFALWQAVGTGAALFLPGATTGLFMLAAVPAALLTPLLFVRMRPLYADLLYVCLLVLTGVRLFL